MSTQSKANRRELLPLLSDQQVRKRTPSYPALRLKQNKHRFYFATVPVDDLFPICFVARRDEDAATGFQRTLTEARAIDIGKYLSSGQGSIPTNIVLSAQPDAQFSYSASSKTVSFLRVPHAAFLVLDGQHRLWGYEKCSLRHRVPVAIYEGLDRAQEAKLFIDINTNQRGVPAALLLDIKKIAEVQSEKEERLREIFDSLGKDSLSPLAGKLSASKTLPGKISRVTFNRSLGGVIETSVMANIESEDRYRLIRNYLNAWDAELAGRDKKMLVRSAFFEAIFDLFEEVVRVTLAAKKNVKPEALQETIRPLAQLDYSQRLTKRTLADLMRVTLREKVVISGDQV